MSRLGMTNEALKLLNPKNFSSSIGANTKFKAFAYNNLACTYMIKVDYEKALLCLNKALEIYPTFDTALKNKAFLERGGRD